MREIKFRGRRKDNGEWVYGWLVKDWDGGAHIVTEFGPDITHCCECGANGQKSFKVDPETVEQIESSAFDAEPNGEVQRLRAALESLPDKIMQISRFADTEELTFPLENPTAEEQSEWLDEFLDRLDMHVRNIIDNEIEGLSTTTEPLNTEKVERVKEGDGNE